MRPINSTKKYNKPINNNKNKLNGKKKLRFKPMSNTSEHSMIFFIFFSYSQENSVFGN